MRAGFGPAVVYVPVTLAQNPAGDRKKSTWGDRPNDAPPCLIELLPMTNILGLAIFALGIVLLIFGFDASHSFASDVSRAFTGNPTNNSVWLIFGGGAAVIVGLIVALRARHE